MPSLRARHSRSCALQGRETRASEPGCTCNPRYHIRGSGGQGFTPTGTDFVTARKRFTAHLRDLGREPMPSAEGKLERAWTQLRRLEQEVDRSLPSLRGQALRDARSSLDCLYAAEDMLKRAMIERDIVQQAV